MVDLLLSNLKNSRCLRRNIIVKLKFIVNIERYLEGWRSFNESLKTNIGARLILRMLSKTENEVVNCFQSVTIFNKVMNL